MNKVWVQRNRGEVLLALASRLFFVAVKVCGRLVAEKETGINISDGLQRSGTF